MENELVSGILGDGGAVMDRFVRQQILSRFNNYILDPLEDASIVPIEEQHLIISTDSFIVDPPFFPNTSIGELSVAGTVNDILASGGIPKYLTLSLIISEGFPVIDLERILNDIKNLADKIPLKIIAGDTKTFKVGGQKPFIFINTTGVGVPIISFEYNFPVSNARIGDVIIVTGQIGSHALAVLSAREGLGFESRVFSDTAALADLIIPFVHLYYPYIHCMRDPSRGGLSGVLIDIATASNVDIEIQYNQIPIQNEVSFGCEMLGLEPIDLVNEGKMVLVVDGTTADDMLGFLRRHPLGKDSCIIGCISERHLNGRVLLDRNGGKSRLFKPERPGIPRLC
ncbi:MAG: Carbamoyl dehydratase HypE [Haliscomenobacter sp.]|nr:Carbamoyl dehydratase HypE [Haliscomenobacter sp.]